MTAETPKPDAKEPPEWGTFFADTKKKLLDLIDKRRSDRALREQTPREKLVALHVAIGRAQRVRNFLDSDLWKDDIEPYLRGAAVLRPWKPGDPLSLEEVAVEHIYNSGNAARASNLVDKLRSWVKEGAEAEMFIKKDTEMKLARTRTQ